MTIEDIKTLLIKLDIAIEAEHDNVNANGIALIFDFTPEQRKKEVRQALELLTDIKHRLELTNNESIKQAERMLKNNSGGVLWKNVLKNMI